MVGGGIFALLFPLVNFSKKKNPFFKFILINSKKKKKYLIMAISAKPLPQQKELSSKIPMFNISERILLGFLKQQVNNQK